LTLRDNVLFDQPFDEDRSSDCLDAAQLSADLINLPNADFTEIGERGIHLSGGQKALARCLSAPRADHLYLLDDILTSVDVPTIPPPLLQECCPSTLSLSALLTSIWI
jgi:ABC-type transport system involved in cytochrome bd biosynthesis fused ATPase/permease subunit